MAIVRKNVCTIELHTKDLFELVEKAMGDDPQGFIAGLGFPETALKFEEWNVRFGEHDEIIVELS